MKQGISWEAKRFSASQDILRILGKPKVHYRIRKCPPPFRILDQISLVHASHPTSWIYILILSSDPRLGLQSGLFPPGFPTKILYAPVLSPISCLVPRPSNFSCLVLVIQKNKLSHLPSKVGCVEEASFRPHNLLNSILVVMFLYFLVIKPTARDCTATFFLPNQPTSCYCTCPHLIIVPASILLLYCHHLVTVPAAIFLLTCRHLITLP